MEQFSKVIKQRQGNFEDNSLNKFETNTSKLISFDWDVYTVLNSDLDQTATKKVRLALCTSQANNNETVEFAVHPSTFRDLAEEMRIIREQFNLIIN